MHAPFSRTNQPRIRVYWVTDNGEHKLYGRYVNISSAIIARDTLVENGDAAYLDVDAR